MWYKNNKWIKKQMKKKKLQLNFNGYGFHGLFCETANLHVIIRGVETRKNLVSGFLFVPDQL